MVFRTITYSVSSDGIEPMATQNAGMQGDDLVTGVEFKISSDLLAKLNAAGGETHYRIQTTDGAGGYHSSGLLTLVNAEGTYTLSFPLGEDITAPGGVAYLHLIISKLIDENEEQTLYSFPARLKFTDTNYHGELEESKKITEALSGAIKAAKRAAVSEEAAKASEASAAQKKQEIETYVKENMTGYGANEIPVGNPSEDPEYAGKLMPSGLTLPELLTDINSRMTAEQVQEAMDNAGVVTTEGFTYYGGNLVVTYGPNQLQSQPIGVWDVVTHSSFENNDNNEIVKVTKYANIDGTYDYRLEASDISADDIVTKEQMELINETTLTEDAVVMFNTDSSGNELALKKFELLVSLPAVTSATTIWTGINGNCVAYTQASSASATNPTYRIWGEYIPAKNSWDFQSAMNNTSGAAVGTIFAFPNGNRYPGTLPSSANGVIIATNAALTNALPAGTKVTLWGV